MGRGSSREIIKYKLNPKVKSLESVAAFWELEDMFFKVNNIKPEWIWVRKLEKDLLNKTTGQWSGGVGHIQRDEADYAVKKYIPSYNMMKVVAFSPTIFTVRYWVTLGREVSPIWNLFQLFTWVGIDIISSV